MHGLVESAASYLIVRNAAQAIAFYTDAFGASEKLRMTDPDAGGVIHAELRFGRSTVMLSDEAPSVGAFSPGTLGGTPVRVHLSTPAVDELAARAARAGATVLRPPQDRDFGVRSAHLVDPFGHHWLLTQEIGRNN